MRVVVDYQNLGDVVCHEMGGLLIAGEAGRGAFTIFRLAPNATSMAFDNRLANGQANAGASSIPLLWMETPEDLEDVIALFFPDSQPVHAISR